VKKLNHNSITKNTGNILLLAILLFTINGCGVYSFTGASISPEVKTISIERFPNNAMTVEPTLSQRFTDDLRDKFANETNLIIMNKGGDLQLSGAITGYRTSPVAIQANETAAMNRLTVTVKVKFINTLDNSKSYENSFSRYQDYASTQNLNDVQDVLIALINEMLVQDIFDKAVVNW
jgi:hypothetical protein